MPRPRAYWIRLDDGVHDDPKTVALAAILGIDEDAIVGKLSRLWIWVRRYYPNAILPKLDPIQIARAFNWQGDRDQLADALIETRWIKPRKYRTSPLQPPCSPCYEVSGYRARNGYQVREQTRNRKRVNTKGDTKDAGNPRDTRANPAPRTYVQDVRTEQQNSPPTPLSESADPHPKTRAARPRRKAARESVEYTFGFVQFWNAYPRKVRKDRAAHAWREVVPGDALLERILTALEWQRRSHDWMKSGGEFIPYPENYLLERRWEDEPQAHAQAMGKHTANNQRAAEEAKEILVQRSAAGLNRLQLEAPKGKP